MIRSLKLTALLALAVASLLVSATHAQDPYQPQYGTVYNGVPYNANGNGYNWAACYPPIHAPLYPCPKPDVPYEVGRTMITNPALAPHEMLYPHCYRALYPPYYYPNKCGLACIPFFPKPRLRGTEVTVKYKSCPGLFDKGYPPCSRVCYSNRGWM